MPQSSFVKFEQFVEDKANGAHNLGSDVLKICLTNTEPDAAADTVYSDIDELVEASGYTLGGETVTVVSSNQTSGTYKLIVDDVVFSASGGAIGPFRYPVLYNSTSTSLIGYWDYGTAISIADGGTFTVDADPIDGVIQDT